MSDPVVHVYPADDAGCGRYRCIWAAEALAAQGADVRLVMPGKADGVLLQLARRDDGTEFVHSVPEHPGCDVLVLQRPLLWQLVDAIPHLQAMGVAVVVELDDDFESVHRQNANWAAVQARANRGANKEWLRKACDTADLLTVSTPALAGRYGRRGRYAIIPNRIPARYLAIDPPPNTDGLVVGWAGALDVHPTDLQVTGRKVGDAVGKAGARFRVIGPGTGVRDRLHLWADPEVTGYVPIDDYPLHVAQLDVALAPLDSIPFNDAKSWLKPLEAAAVGVPCVASPVREYYRAEREGLCTVAVTPNQWEAKIRDLLRNDDLRATMSVAGRVAAGAHTIEGHLDSWMDAWRRAAATRGATHAR